MLIKKKACMLASYRLTNYTTKLTVTHHPKDGHPPSKIYQKEERLGIWYLDLTHKSRLVQAEHLSSASACYLHENLCTVYFIPTTVREEERVI